MWVEDLGRMVMWVGGQASHLGQANRHAGVPAAQIFAAWSLLAEGLFGG